MNKCSAPHDAEKSLNSTGVLRLCWLRASTSGFAPEVTLAKHQFGVPGPLKSELRVCNLSPCSLLYSWIINLCSICQLPPLRVRELTVQSWNYVVCDNRCNHVFSPDDTWHHFPGLAIRWYRELLQNTMRTGTVLSRWNQFPSQSGAKTAR